MRQLADQFEGDFELEFYMAPPALAKPEGQRGRRARCASAPGCCRCSRCSPRASALRGTALDPFGRTEERRLERRLVDEYEARVRELLVGADAGARWPRGRDRQRAAQHPRLRPRQARQPRDRPGARERAAAPLRSGALSAAARPRPSPASSAAFRSPRPERRVGERPRRKAAATLLPMFTPRTFACRSPDRGAWPWRGPSPRLSLARPCTRSVAPGAYRFHRRAAVRIA